MTTDMSQVSSDSLVMLSAPARNGKGEETRYLDIDSGWVYAADGEKIQKMVVGDRADSRMLSDYAAQYDAECISANTGRPVTLRDSSWATSDNPKGERVVDCRHVYDDRGNRVGHADLRTLALAGGELAPGDVHIDRGLPNVAFGYALAGGIADVVSPPFLVPNQSDKYWTWSEKNAYVPVMPLEGGAGGGTPEVQGSLSTTNFQTKAYTLGTFITTELQANADAPLNVTQAFMRLVMDKQKLARERRVQNTVQTSGSWNSALVLSVPAANKWNGGVSSNPIDDLKAAIRASYMDPTDIAMSKLVFDYMQESAFIGSRTQAKDRLPAYLSPEEMSKEFGLPRIHIADMKYLASVSSSAAMTYVWGNHVVLFRSTAALASQQDICTTRTFRWSGGVSPDGTTQAGGWHVRTYYDKKRGPLGGTAIVTSIYDDDSILVGKNTGGLIQNAYQ